MNSEAAKIEQFLNGTLESVDREKFEAGMVNDLFLREAVAGFRKDPGALHDLPVYGNLLRWWVWGFAGIAVALVVFLISSPKPNREYPVLKFSKPTNTFPIPDAVAKLEAPAILFPISNHGSKRTVEISIPKRAVEQSAESDRVFLNPINFQKPAQLTLNTAVPRLKIDAHIIYILDYKTIQYPKNSEASPSFELDKLTRHTPANFASSAAFDQIQSVSKSFSMDDEPESYSKRLGMGLKALRDGNYESALRIFNQLTVENTLDVNAAFYSGICRFETGDYASSLQLFTKVEKTMNPAFGPEARWYRSLSLLKLGRRDEAETILREIIAGGGHYAERAKLEVTPRDTIARQRSRDKH